MDSFAAFIRADCVWDVEGVPVIGLGRLFLSCLVVRCAGGTCAGCGHPHRCKNLEGGIVPVGERALGDVSHTVKSKRGGSARGLQM